VRRRSVLCRVGGYSSLFPDGNGSAASFVLSNHAPAGDDDFHGRHRPVVRADGRDSAGEALVRRIDRDVRPIFRPTNAHAGGLVNEYPFVSGGWSDNQLGDLWLGGKVNLMSEWQQKPLALAVRGMVKLPTLVSDSDTQTHFTVGLTWLSKSGFFAGVGANWRFGMDGRDSVGSEFGNVSGDSFGFQARIGYHPGVRIYVPPPPPPPPPAPTPAPQNRPPTVKARCEPCTVEIGRTSTVTAGASDPDGDTLSYKWSAPAGSFTRPADRQTPWTAPMQEGPVQVQVCVADGKSGTACDTITIQVIRPVVKEFVFEDVHFDFDRYSLRPEATRALDEAIKTLQQNPTLRIQIEGHTCNIGTAEYNLALGDRRANAVMDYLTSRGIAADRLQSVSYGEERPKHDNSREETRRLNRRAAMVVRVQ
jgi:outer membrane protein OmpA-like peptidoglycan-associated protein